MNALQTCIAELEKIIVRGDPVIARVVTRLKDIDDYQQAETVINESAYLNQDGDPINNPTHYNSHPSGVECIQITEHMSFNLGNAIKYIWRADLKGNATQDLEKAKWYIERELLKRANNLRK